jgi:two-component system, cell cycle response regulator
MTEEKTSVQKISDLLGKVRQQTAYLIVLSAKSAAGIGTMFKLDQPEHTLGRSAEATYRVDDDGISRKHAKVVLGPEGHFQLVDLGSTNGTYLNGVRITVATLHDGDKVQIGSHTVLKFSLQDALEEQFQRNIYESATRDGLTRIFNKKYFLEILKKEFAYCVRHRVPMALVMMDVDHFKKVNDTHGHPAGDLVLARVAQRINETIRSEDVFARYGGEEFSLLLRESNEDKAVSCAERCRRAVESTDYDHAGVTMKVTISLGVASLFDSDYAQAEDLIATADRYLYRAKKAGRNRVQARTMGGPLSRE